MANTLRYVGLSYKNAPVNIREFVAFDDTEGRKFLRLLKDILDVQEALILSTCNRTEIYYASKQDKAKDIIKLMSVEKGQGQSVDLAPYIFSCSSTDEATKHLFRVSVGLESMVIGDLQISNQVKRAYQMSAEEEMAGPMLHRLLHTIFFTNKRIVQETAFRDGAASVSYATAELVKDLGSNLLLPKVLIFGVGEIGADVARNLVGSEIQNVVIVNRTFEKAQKLAEELNFKAEPLVNIKGLIETHDIIISSVNAPHPIISYDIVKEVEILGYKHFIDLSVPRSIEQEVDTVPAVSLYNIDHIQSKTNEAMEKRLASVPRVEEIVSEALAEFRDWSKEMLVSPAINKFKNALEEIRKEELEKCLKKVKPEQVKVIDQVTKNMVQKIIKLPVLNLKAACKRDEAETLADVLIELFDLGKVTSKKK